MKHDGYHNIKIRADLYEKITAEVKKNKTGFSSNAEYVRHCIRTNLKNGH